jgi:ubiquinone/menaquinone biosynthesis C-methylase UbiE
MPSPSLTALAAAVLHVRDLPERILEVGCGAGDGVLFLAREFPAARVRGVDPSGEAIAAAVGRVGLDPEGRVAFKQGKPGRLPYPDGFFDLVALSSGGLHPRELARVLRPGGHLIAIGHRRWLEWRLGARRFDPVDTAGVEGERFQVFRLHAGASPDD